MARTLKRRRRSLSPAPPPLVEARGLTKEYPRDGGVTRVVDDVSFVILPGETLGLVGESGSGKSTVARMLLRLIEPTAGEVLFDGQPLPPPPPPQMRALRRRMQIVFQDPYAALNPRMTRSSDSCRAIRHPPRTAAGRLPARPAPNSSTLSAWMSRPCTRYPHEFSGGQRQRINIARALALRPSFLVLDEPVSALDVSVGAQVINLLRDLQRTLGLTYLFISHSMPLVRYLCDRVAVMQRGRLVEIGDCMQVCEAPRNAYTRQLIAAPPKCPCRRIGSLIRWLADSPTLRLATIESRMISSLSAHVPYLWLVSASFIAGVMNAMAGGGSFISFPAMLAIGVPPIQANATNTVALWPGQLTSIWALRTDLRRDLVAVVVAASIVGGIGGAVVLLHTPQITFMHMVPWLLLVASLLFWISGPISRWLRRRSDAAARSAHAVDARALFRDHPGHLLHRLLRRGRGLPADERARPLRRRRDERRSTH